MEIFMRKILLFFSVFLVFLFSCTPPDSFLIQENPVGESRGAFDGDYVRLIVAYPNSTATTLVIQARRGQPFAAPYDGKLEVFYREEGGPWKSRLLGRSVPTTPNDSRYVTSIDANYASDYIEFYLRLTVFHRCYYDGFISDPYFMETNWNSGEIEAVVGHDFSFCEAKVDVLPYYPGFVRYKLWGSFYIQSGISSDSSDAIVGYKTPYGTVEYADVTYSSIAIPGIKYCRFSAHLGIGGEGNPVPTFSVWGELELPQNSVIDDNFGKYYKVSDQFTY